MHENKFCNMIITRKSVTLLLLLLFIEFCMPLSLADYDTGLLSTLFLTSKHSKSITTRKTFKKVIEDRPFLSKPGMSIKLYSDFTKFITLNNFSK